VVIQGLDSAQHFIDAIAGTIPTHAQLRHFALTFGYGLLRHPNLVKNTQQKRGDTVLMYSPISLVWRVVFYGCLTAGLRCTPRRKPVLTREEGLNVVWEMFKELGVGREEGENLDSCVM